MKVRLLRKLRREAFNELKSYSIRQNPTYWEIFNIKYTPLSPWIGNLARFIVTDTQARVYRMDIKITRSFFKTMLRCRAFSVRWHYSDGYCCFVRNRYRRYTRKWKSAHGVSLGIKAENDWW